MKNIAAIFIKELHSYFVSVIAYIVIIGFIALSGLFFTSALARYSFSQDSVEFVTAVLFGNMSVMLLFIIPLLTMRLFAEEKKSGTIELLMTSPVRDTEVVIGKFLAGWALLVGMLLLSFLFPVLMTQYGNPDFGPIFSSYLGLILLGSCFLSLGIMVSSMTKNQIVAAFVSFGTLLFLWVIGFLSNRAGVLGDILGYISLVEHFEYFSRGIVGLKHVVYYLSFIAVCLFLTVKSVESAKWR